MILLNMSMSVLPSCDTILHDLQQYISPHLYLFVLFMKTTSLPYGQCGNDSEKNKPMTDNNDFTLKKVFRPLCTTTYTA